MLNRQPFGELFLARLRELEFEAKSVGLNMTTLCKEAKVSRASPDRWRRELPKTIALIQRMEELVQAEREKLQEQVQQQARQLRRSRQATTPDSTSPARQTRAHR